MDAGEFGLYAVTILKRKFEIFTHTSRYIITYTQKNKPVFLCFEKKFKKKYYFVRLIDTIIIISYPRDERKKEKKLI